MANSADAADCTVAHREVAGPVQRSAARKRVGVIAGVVAGISAAMLAFGEFWPSALEDESAGRRMLDAVAFFVQTLRLHLAIGLLPVLTLAVAFRSRRSSIALVGLVFWASFPTVQRFVPAGRSMPDASDAQMSSDGPTLSLISANLLAWNRTPEALAAELAASDADVILLQEYTGRWQQIIRARLATRWPFQCEAPQEDCFGVAVFSRLPFAEAPTRSLPIGETDNPQLRVAVEFGGRKLALYNVHLLPPISDEYIRINRREFVDLERILAEERWPAAVCGDFNFTNDVAQADRLFALGFRDGLDEGAIGPLWTWPAHGPRRLLPGIRIDHVYLRGPISCRSAALAPSHGSDHRPIAATLEWRP